MARFIEFTTDMDNPALVNVEHIAWAVLEKKQGADKLIIWAGGRQSTVRPGEESDRVWGLLQQAGAE